MVGVSPDPEGPPADRARALNLSSRWRTEGEERKARARAARRCVECERPLASGRSPYCSPRCLGRFHGRYFWDAARVVVMRRDRYTCRICRERKRARELEVDHVIELAAGGAPLDYANLQTVCRPCHRRKTLQFVRWRAGGARRRRSVRGAADDLWALEWFPS